MRKKRGESQYISWILIFGLVVALSYMLYNWSLEQARKTGEQLEASADPLICSEIGISIEGVCQTSNTLELNITNINNLEIEGFLIKTIGLYPEDPDYLGENTVSSKIKPGETEKVTILKQGTLSQIEITPFGNKKNKNIYCEEKSIKKEKNELKYC